MTKITLRVVEVKRKPPQCRPVQRRKELFLIIYDTVWVHRVHKRRDPELEKENPGGIIEVKEKYALALTYPDDANMIGQCYAMRGSASEAEWTHDWHGIPAAIERLRARHADEPFPNEIGHVLDWPSHHYWEHVKSVSNPARQKFIQVHLDRAGRS